MAERNRVTPTGEIVSTEQRGAWMGNRGCLHDGHAVVRRWRSRAWITCQLSYKGWRMEQWAPGRYTVLFFHDEAVALAAGHRPCALCRRPELTRFASLWSAATGAAPRAAALDDRLHAERIEGGGQRRHRLEWTALPDGAFVLTEAGPAIVLADQLVTWSTDAGYTSARGRPSSGTATVLTPPSTVAVLAAGYRPQVDDVAVALARGARR